MFNIDHVHWANPFWEVKDFMLGEWLRCEPAFILFPNDGRIQTLFNRRPDGKAWRKVITINGDIPSIADSDLSDLIEEMILGVTCEHICHARLHTESDQREQTLLLPLFGSVELIITQFNASEVERVGRVWLGQGHRHVHVFRTDIVGRVEDL